MKDAIKYFIQNPVVVNLILILIIIVGVISFTQIKSTSEPQAKERNISIEVTYRGASPKEVENSIVNKIEENLEGIKGLRKVISESREGFAYLDLLIKEESDINIVLQDVKDAVGKINSFPEGMDEPVISKAEVFNRTFSFAVNGDVSLFEIKDYANQIKDALLDDDGISTVLISGFPEEEIEILVSEDKLKAYRLSMNDVSKAISEANIELTAGTIKTTKQNISIRANAKGYYANDLKNIVVRANTDGSIIFLEDIASIENIFSDAVNKRFLNGKPSATIEVLSRTDENLLENAETIKEYISEFNRNNKIVKLEVIDDSSIHLRTVLNTMIQNGVIGFLLVLIILTLFLQRKLAFWVALKIPVAFLGMLILGSYYGLTFNMVSIFGFILVLGILVDDGIVIGENIYQHYENYKKKPLKAALDGASQMLVPVFISLSTTSIAFSLFFFLSGRSGDMFSELAFVVIGTLFFALIESFFLLPAHLSHSLSSETKASRAEKFFNNGLLRVRDKFYIPVFRFIVSKYKLLALFVFILALIFTLGLVGTNRVKVSFFPTMDDSFLISNLELKPGTSEEITLKSLQGIEQKVWDINKELTKEAKSAQNIIKNTELILGPLSNEGQLKIILIDSDERDLNSFEITKYLQNRIGEIPEAINFTIGGLSAETMFGKPISVSLYGDDLEEIREAANQLKTKFQDNPKLRDVKDSDKTGNPEINIWLKPLAHHVGLTHNNVMQQIRSGYFGLNIQSLQRNDEEVKVWLRYDDKKRSTIEELEELVIVSPTNGEYRLKDVAYLEFTEGVLQINHNKRKTEIKVEADLADINISAPQTLAELEENEILETLSGFRNITYEIGGQNEETQDLMNRIKVVGPIILLIIFSLVVFNGKSFSQAGAIFLTFPFALIGVILGHYIHGAMINMFSFLGLIALIGVFVNDSLVYTTTLNDNLKEGLDYMDALVETAKSRFRPIVLTTITTVAGLSPTLYSDSFATMMLKPPAISIAYGLIFGLIMPLFLLPIILIATNYFKRLWIKIVSGKVKKAEEVEAAVKQLKSVIK